MSLSDNHDQCQISFFFTYLWDIWSCLYTIQLYVKQPFFLSITHGFYIDLDYNYIIFVFNACIESKKNWNMSLVLEIVLVKYMKIFISKYKKTVVFFCLVLYSKVVCVYWHLNGFFAFRLLLLSNELSYFFDRLVIWRIFF